MPKSSGGGTGGQPAKDALGNDITSASWLKSHKPNTRELTQGLKVGVARGARGRPPPLAMRAL